MVLSYLHPDARILACAVALDLVLGDPVYRLHPVRLMGWTLVQFERALRAIALNGYGGGAVLFLLLAAVWVAGLSACTVAVGQVHAIVGMLVHLYLLYSLLALRDLLRHGWAVESAAQRGDLAAARQAIAQLVGRDLDRMDLAACRRAAIESLSENITDGFISPLFWYVITGLPGILLFKVVSTMDSMVGYKTPQYLRLGCCGARLDDAMNWLPARISWLLIAIIALPIASCSAAKALRIGWRQHAIVPGPNSGWSEAATAGAIQRRLAGPIWKDGNLINELWLGDAEDPPAGGDSDLPRASGLVAVTGIAAAVVSVLVIFACRWARIYT